MNPIKIILIDDHQLVRDGIKSLLNDAPNISIIGQAGSVKELMELIDQSPPDIVMMDISLPGISGLEATRTLSEEFPGIRVLILTMHTGEDFIFNAIKAGAKGYLPKNTTKKELIEAVNRIYAGEEYFSESISNIILKSYIQKAQKGEKVSDRNEDKLSTREIEILKLFAGGLSNQEIADKLFISIRTVESHKNHIMQKLELDSTVDLIKFAIKNKIIEI
jgi:DNA-binding NarL/FixJ family response regulator